MTPFFEADLRGGVREEVRCMCLAAGGIDIGASANSQWMVLPPR
jgi:hypothetical protein